MVRETVGLVAYRAAQWADAISELRAARRMAGGTGQIAVIADAERALGHPEKALEIARSPEAARLDPAQAAELQIVVAGARADLGQQDAALVALKTAARNVDAAESFAFRVYYAYAAMLESAGNDAEALEWFVRAADADADEESDAAERAAILSGGADDGDPTGEPTGDPADDRREERPGE